MDFDFDEDYESFGAADGPDLQTLPTQSQPPQSQISPLRSLREERLWRQLGVEKCPPLPGSPQPSAGLLTQLTTPPRNRAAALDEASTLQAVAEVDSESSSFPVAGPEASQVEQMPMPNEDAFVASRAAVRRQEYQRLEAWLLAGGSADQFLPWFRELLMDVDGPALVAACRAVAAHYLTARHVAPSDWLQGLGERLLTAGPAESAAAVDLAAAVAAVSDLWAELAGLLRAGSVATAAGALQLLAACAEHGIVGEEQLQTLAKTLGVSAVSLTAGNDASAVKQPLAKFISTLKPHLRHLLPASLLNFAKAVGQEATSPSYVSSPQQLPTSPTLNSTVVSPPTKTDPLRLLGTGSSPKTWRQRLACLESMLGPDGDGFHGPMLWPQLVLQAEDDHPAVACAALKAIARLVPNWAVDQKGQLPGDHLVSRLAAALRSRLKEGRHRGFEAANACITALAQFPAAIGGSAVLSTFLALALGISKDRARSTVAELREEADERPQADGQLPAVLEGLLLEASARRPGQKAPATPSPSPARRGFSSLLSPVERESPSALLPAVPFSPEELMEADDWRQDEEASEWTIRAPVMAPTSAGSSRPSRYASLAGSPPAPPSGESQRSFLTLPSAYTPPRRGGGGLSALSTTPEARGPVFEGLAAETLKSWGQEHLAAREAEKAKAAAEAVKPSAVVPSAPPPSWSGIPGSTGSSLAGPQLRGDSKLVGLSQVLRSTATEQKAVLRSTALGQSVSSAALGRPVAAADDLKLGFDALLEGRGPEALHKALEVLVADGGHEAALLVEVLLAAAARLPPAVQPELWLALMKLREATWLSEPAILELSVGHCLAFTAPEVVASFLTEHAAAGRLSVQGIFEFCLGRLPASSRGCNRLAQLISQLAKMLLSPKSGVRGDLHLPSLSAFAEWASAGQLPAAALGALQDGLEKLLQHLAPESVSERCWGQLLKLLSPGHQSSPAVAREAFVPMHVQATEEIPEADTFSCEETAEVGGQAQEVQTSSLNNPSDVLEVSTDFAELSATLGRLHKITLELTRKAEASDDVVGPLQVATQLLSRPQTTLPLQAFLRRLLARQRLRANSKENFPPPGLAGPGAQPKHSGGNFLSDDYASVRELSADEGLAGAFPHSLLAHLKRFLRAPAAAATHRAAAECLGAVASACGSLLLKVLLGHFAAALLRMSAARGPAQAAARSALSKMVILEDASGTRPPPNNSLRITWRALMQAIAVSSNPPSQRSGGSPSPGGAGEQVSGLLVEALRWLSEDALPLLQQSVSAYEAKDVIAVVAPSLLDRSHGLRSVAGRCLLALAAARGGREQLKEDLLSQLLSPASRSQAMSVLSTGAPPISPPVPPALSTNRRSPGTGTPATAASRQSSSVGLLAGPRSVASRRRLQFSPGSASPEESSPPPWLRGQQRRRSLPPDTLAKRVGLEMVAEVASVAPEVDGLQPQAPLATPGACASAASPSACAPAASPGPSCIQSNVSAMEVPNASCSFSSQAQVMTQEIEAELTAWAEELSRPPAPAAQVSPNWETRIASLRSRLESIALRTAAAGSQDVGSLVLPVFILCARLAARAGFAELALDEESSESAPALLRAMQAAVSAAADAFPPSVLQQLTTPAAAAAMFRSVLQMLAQLQTLSRSQAEAIRKSAAPVLMELPPLLARLVDSVEAAVQLVSWLRVANELLYEAHGSLGTEDAAVTRRWALRFCSRCVERCLTCLQPGPQEFCAWEVLSELTRLNERKAMEVSGADDEWIKDSADWQSSLEDAARVVSKHYPAQAREFLLLASCTGSPIPGEMQHLLQSAQC